MAYGASAVGWESIFCCCLGQIDFLLGQNLAGPLDLAYAEGRRVEKGAGGDVSS